MNFNCDFMIICVCTFWCCYYIFVLLLFLLPAALFCCNSLPSMRCNFSLFIANFFSFLFYFVKSNAGLFFASRVPRQPIRHTISVISFSFSGLLYFLCIYSHSHIPLSFQFRRLLGAPLSFHCDFNSITAHDCHFCCCYCCCGMMLLLFLCFITITVRLPLLTCCCCRTFYSYAFSTFCPLEVIPEGY